MYKNMDTLTASSLIQLARGLAAPHVVFERPPEGIARGLYVWPAWGVIAVAVAAVALGALFWLLPMLDERKARQSARPHKGRPNSQSPAP